MKARLIASALDAEHRAESAEILALWTTPMHWTERDLITDGGPEQCNDVVKLNPLDGNSKMNIR